MKSASERPTSSTSAVTALGSAGEDEDVGADLHLDEVHRLGGRDIAHEAERGAQRGGVVGRRGGGEAGRGQRWRREGGGDRKSGKVRVSWAPSQSMICGPAPAAVLPAPTMNLSEPPPPARVLAFDEPSMVSSPAPPFMNSAPWVPDRESLPLPPVEHVVRSRRDQGVIAVLAQQLSAAGEHIVAQVAVQDAAAGDVVVALAAQQGVDAQRLALDGVGALVALDEVARPETTIVSLSWPP